MTTRRGRATLALSGQAAATVPLALAGHQRRLAVGDRVDVRVDGSWAEARLADVVVGAGFVLDRISRGRPGDELVARATRARTLPDTVGPGMALLVSGSTPACTRPTRASPSPGPATGSGRPRSPPAWPPSTATRSTPWPATAWA